MSKFEIRLLATALCSLSALALPQSSRAGNLVANGDFEATTSGSGQLGFNTDATGWTTTGYNFLFTPGSADTTGVDGRFGNVELWGPNNGSANGLPATSPTGGNYVAADGAYEVGAISQTITGLTAGQTYDLSFYWAAAQQSGFTGPNTEQWQVGFGAETQSTPIYHNASQGFSGWMAQTFTFTADSTSDVLSFLAVGTPAGEPPFSLLDGVSLQASSVPDATSTAVLFGLTASAIGFAARRCRK